MRINLDIYSHDEVVGSGFDYILVGMSCVGEALTIRGTNLTLSHNPAFKSPKFISIMFTKNTNKISMPPTHKISNSYRSKHVRFFLTCPKRVLQKN